MLLDVALGFGEHPRAANQESLRSARRGESLGQRMLRMGIEPVHAFWGILLMAKVLQCPY